MGSGKSYIGYLLSLLTNYKFFDLDNIINNLYNTNINNFFKIYGEKKFRIIENKILKFFLINYKNKSYILSVGGGTPCYYNNINIMNFYANTIYLKINYKILYDRLLKDNKDRPILQNKINLLKFIKLHLEKRIKFYNKSKNIININNMNFLETAYYIKNKFNI